MLVKTSWLDRSRNGRPSPSHTQDPCAPTTTNGSSIACADQEWKTCARSSARVRAAPSGSGAGDGAVGGSGGSDGRAGVAPGSVVGRVLVMPSGYDRPAATAVDRLSPAAPPG